VFDTPVSLAGIQVTHAGRATPGTEVFLLLTDEEGAVEKLGPWTVERNWSNGNILFPIVPLGDPMMVKQVEVTPKLPLFKTMEFWTTE
jgi:hypothetical protein